MMYIFLIHITTLEMYNYNMGDLMYLNYFLPLKFRMIIIYGEFMRQNIQKII